MNDDNINNENLTFKSQNSIRKECRYCLSDDRSETLIDPCECEGTMKYVHKDCLENWIENGKRPIQEIINDKNTKIYLFICEVCKYQIKYTKTYKNNVFLSLIKLIKTVFGDCKNSLLFLLHSVIIFFLFKRLRLFYSEFLSSFRKKINLIRNPSFMMDLFHNLTILTSIIAGINDIYMFYSKMYTDKRKCIVSFMPKRFNL